MLDLKIYDEDQYDLVPVPLPGRLMIFAGPTGLMCRRNDGTIVAYPETTGGGGLVEPVGAIEFQPVSFPQDVRLPATGGYTLGMVGSDLVVAYEGGAVVRVGDGVALYSPE